MDITFAGSGAMMVKTRNDEHVVNDDKRVEP